MAARTEGRTRMLIGAEWMVGIYRLVGVHEASEHTPAGFSALCAVLRCCPV